MCGIAGFISPNLSDSRGVITAMTERLSHRGPSGGGIILDPTDRVALGHRRLSILDLSDAGSQPMKSASGRFWIVFNGEVYNFKELKKELQSLGHTFRSESDTEVILAAFEEWEIYEAVPKFNGMFAIALWDEKTQKLFLIRDRVGVKPLYYGVFGNNLVFGSELKSILCHPAATKEISPVGLSHFMRFGYIPAPLSIYENIAKVNQSSILSASLNNNEFILNEYKYWSATPHALAQSEYLEDTSTAVKSLHNLLRDSIKLRMISDVPIGTFLSGGIDSSLVTAIMQEQSTKPVRTFTIGFPESAFDESIYAAAIAKHLGTNHTTMMVNPEDALNIIPNMPIIYDEPFGDSSALPTILLAGLTKQHVTVSLSGDGGDELFLGYSRYHSALAIWQVLKFIPAPIRKIIHQALKRTPTAGLDLLFSLASDFLPSALKFTSAGQRIQRFAARMDAKNFTALYRNLISHWPKNALLIHSDKILPFIDDSIETTVKDLSFMSLYDLVSYLPDDIMTKVDRASMAYGLESREPLLDHRIIESALRMPNSLKVRAGESKWILRKILESYVPNSLFERTKMGFGVPLDSWLRGPLKDWAEDLIYSTNNTNHNLFDFVLVQKYWQEHLHQRANHGTLLWDILMFQSWFNIWQPSLNKLNLN
jgi:asparagine synthase (glutamine-hydrolysing)